MSVPSSLLVQPTAIKCMLNEVIDGSIRTCPGHVRLGVSFVRHDDWFRWLLCWFMVSAVKEDCMLLVVNLMRYGTQGGHFPFCHTVYLRRGSAYGSNQCIVLYG